MARRLLAVLLTVIIVAGGFTAPVTSLADTQSTSSDQVDLETEPATIDPALEDLNGTTTVVARLPEAQISADTAADKSVQRLKDHAQRTQKSVVAYAQNNDGVEVVNQFWISNAVLLRVDTAKTSIDTLAKIQGVEELHANFKVTTPEPKKAADKDSSSDTTYGLNQINVPEVWDELGVKGQGVDVAVLDTGVDASHPDINLYTEDPNDPTYPGGWAEFDSNGNIVPDSEPHDTQGHGTHTSGTVAGGDATGTHIGVAPEANLMHGLVLSQDGGSFAQVLGGMQWAVTEDADVVSMSLGATGYAPQMIEPVQNIQDAGAILIAAIGNDGEGTSGSPGNVYESTSIGATDPDVNIAPFSGGEEIDTSQAWGSAAPADWPSSYIVPDVAAPGVSVISSVPGGDYASFSGTSMATPHVAGVAALMVSAAGEDLDPSTISDTLSDTAWKPDGAPAEKDHRYGNGVIDAFSAVQQVANDGGIEGTVTDSSGNPIASAEVSTSYGSTTTTDSNGAYSVLVPEGSWEVTADAFGYEATSTTVDVGQDSVVTQDFTLSEAVAAEITEGQPEAIEGGQTIETTYTVAHANSVTVTLDGSYSASNADLYVNGMPASFGDPVSIDDEDVVVQVETESSTTGSISLETTFQGTGDPVSVTSGPTEVFEEYSNVAVVVNGDSPYSNLEQTLNEHLPSQYEVETIQSDNLIEVAEGYDSFVVQEFGGDAATVEEFLSITDNTGAGVVFLDQWGGYSNAIQALSAVNNNPDEVQEDYNNNTPVKYKITQDHPIFQGIGSPGDIITVYNDDTFTDRAWFTGYTGDTLAEVSDADTSSFDGPSVAISDDEDHVLMTLGRSTYIEESTFTDDANELLANGIEFVSGEVTSDGTTISVSDAATTTDGMATVNVSTDGTNVAGYEANLTFDPSVVQVQDISGVDFADPVVNVDNEEGWIYFTSSSATGQDAPTLAQLELNVTTQDSTTTTVGFNEEETLLNSESGTISIDSYSPGEVTVEAGIPGDVNEDGEVNSLDATLTQRYIVGLGTDGTFNPELADMNDDGAVSSIDVTMIYQTIVGSAERSASSYAQEGDLYLGSAEASTGDTATVPLYAENASNVAGYQANFTFNPDIVQVEGVSGADLSDPIVNVDNEEGWVYFTASEASGTDNPEFAEITLSVVGESGDETPLEFVDSDTAVNTESGILPVTLHDGSVSVVGASVTDYSVSETALQAGQSTTVTATVENPSQSSADVAVEFMTDGTAKTTETVSVGSGETTTVEFTTSFDTSGTHTVSINDLPPTEVQVASTTLNLADVEGQPDSTTTVPLEVTGDGSIAGYSANVTFDPSVIQIQDVTGADFGAPTANINNDEGWVYFTQSTAQGMEEPVLAQLSVEIVAGSGNETSLSFVESDTSLNNEQGDTVPVALDDGSVSVSSCTLGDANGDGVVGPADATVTQRAVIGLPVDGEFNPECADVDGNGQVGPGDVTLIQRLIIGLPI